MGIWKRRKMLEAGEKAPDFELTDLEGRIVSLRELTSEGPVLLAFFKITCPVCAFTFPFLERIHQTVGAKRLRVYGISQDDAHLTRQFNSEVGVSFPVLLDTAANGYAVSNAYGIFTVPSLFLVEEDGVISWASGGFAKSELEGLGQRFGVEVFRAEENVPAWKAG